MSSNDVPMKVASVRLDKEGSQVHVTFELANTRSSKLYDFVKLFIGDEYIGLKYIDIPDGESRPVEFRFDPTAITGAPDMILTAGDREDGVLFQEPLRDVSDADLLENDAIKEQAKRLAETDISSETWERLEDEYIDLVQDQASRKQQVMERLREEYEQLREQKREQEKEEPFPDETGTEPASSETHESDQLEPPEPRKQDDTAQDEETGDDEEIQVQTLDGDDWTEDEEDTEEDGKDHRDETGDSSDQDKKIAEAPERDETREEQAEEQEKAPLEDHKTSGDEPEIPSRTEPPAEAPEHHGDVGEAIQEHEEQTETTEPDEPKSNLLQSVVGSVFGSENVDEASETPEEQSEDDEDTEEDDKDKTYGPDEDELNDIPTIDSDIKPSEKVKRRSTGIEGLDAKMQGGLVDGTMNLVTGKTGTGKTAFCANFLRRGAELDEPGVYVTTEEREEDIMADIESMFGWDFRSLEEQDKVKILSIKPIFPSKEIDNLNRLVRSYISNLLDEVMQAVDDIDADRVIIDSVSIIEMFIRDEYMARVALASLLNKLREAEVTAVLTGTVPETSEGLSGGGIIEFLVDTVLLLEFVPVAEEYSRTLTIRKMRRTDHDVEIFPIEITPHGMKLNEV